MNALKALNAKRLPTVTRQIFSGIQPTGVPHLGNYLGALRQWVQLQDDALEGDRLTFCVVDLHALTARPDPILLQQNRRIMLASLLAVGLDPTRSAIYYQSSLSQHAELMWLLGCHASVGYLSRMTQWKSKLEAGGQLVASENATSQERLKLGLFSYPVLQAADILLHGTTHVPVGEDQSQHIEFAREIAMSFNYAYKGDDMSPPLVVPETILSPAKRVMSLTDPRKKMSKSDPKPASRILINDSAEQIQRKIKSALTDSIEGISFEPVKRPEVSNLVAILSHLDKYCQSPEEIAKDCERLSMRSFKDRVAAALDQYLAPIRDKYNTLINKREDLDGIARLGAAQARTTAVPRLNMIKKTIGILDEPPEKEEKAEKLDL